MPPLEDASLGHVTTCGLHVQRLTWPPNTDRLACLTRGVTRLSGVCPAITGVCGIYRKPRVIDPEDACQVKLRRAQRLLVQSGHTMHLVEHTYTGHWRQVTRPTKGHESDILPHMRKATPTISKPRDPPMPAKTDRTPLQAGSVAKVAFLGHLGLLVDLAEACDHGCIVRAAW